MSAEREDNGLDAAGQQPALTRRRLLAQAGGLALALSGAATLVAACGGGSEEPTPDTSEPPAASGTGAAATGTETAASGGQEEGIGGIPVASKQQPVTLPLFEDNPAIAAGLEQESGPLLIFDWADYLSPAVVASFEEKYGVKTNITNYASFQESLNKISSGAIKADLWVPVVERLPQLVAAKLIQPLNRDYIPNLAGAVPALENPYYDQGSQYSVPNYIWTTGIIWRSDLLPDLDPASADNPWDVFWSTSGVEGKLGLQNAEPFDPLSLGLLRNGVTDFTTITKEQVDEAVAALEELVAKGAKFQYTSFQPIANGTQVLAQGWNGDAFVAPAFLPPDVPASAVRYFFPEDGVGSVNNDFWCIPKTSENPVLAHLFMNHFLEVEQGVESFKAVGYQVPLKEMTVDLLEERGVGDPELLDMVYVTDTAASAGLPNPTPTAEQLEWYEAAFSSLTAG